MHNVIDNLNFIQNEIKIKIKKLNFLNYSPKIIAVSKTFPMKDIIPLINNGHIHFGENKVQEALLKWTKLKEKYEKVELHMLGKLQTNKVKHAVEIFDYIHSLDNLKLANKLADEISKKGKNIKMFIQINLGGEKQKSGIDPSELEQFYKECCNLNLNIIGTMCIPPEIEDPKSYFKKLLELNEMIGLGEISMGMTKDYLEALEYKATFLRIGSGIFGQRSS